MKGLRGGHSGLEIHTGRGNALKIMTRVLLGLAKLGGRVAKIEGGNKRNAIPREAEAIVWVPKAKAGQAAEFVAAMNAAVRNELATVEPNLSVACSAQKGVRKVLKKGVQKKVLLALIALPHGVLKMSADIPGLVETSSNVAIIETGQEGDQDPDEPAQLGRLRDRGSLADGARRLRAGRRRRHRLRRLPGLEAEPRVADPQTGESPPISRSTARNPR